MTAVQRGRNWFAVWVTVGVVVIVLGIGAAVAVFQATDPADGSSRIEATVDHETGAISLGSGTRTVDLYVDFMCPHCAAFEAQYGQQLAELARDDRITLRIHPVALLDRASAGTAYSTRAANAAYCTAESSATAVLPFVRALFDRQRPEGSAGLDDSTLTAVAREHGADIAACQDSQAHRAEVGEYTAAMPADPATGRTATPTVLIDGTYTPLSDVATSPGWFRERFE